jgi:hypothetical protein
MIRCPGYATPDPGYVLQTGGVAWTTRTRVPGNSSRVAERFTRASFFSPG